MLRPMSFLPVAEIEEMAQRLVLRLVRDGAIALPIAVEWVAEGLLDLAIEWGPLPITDEGALLAGLDVRTAGAGTQRSDVARIRAHAGA